MVRENGKELADVPREEMESLWEKAKDGERKSAGAAR
jgi:hypothetical protein